MIEIALMIEGQDGLNWDRWRRIAQVAEDAGYVGLYRSDHFTNPQGPYKDSLECWTSLTWLASHSSRLEFGPLVSPVSFHHPSNLVRMAAAVDDLAGGRLWLGLGAGWQEREHTNYGFTLGSVPERMTRFREAVHIISHLLHSDEPLTFRGKYYTLQDAVLLPRPARRVPIVIGGSGRQITLPLAARYADEWNIAFRTPEQFRELSAHLDSLLDGEGRPRSAVRRTLMTRLEYARHDQVREQVAAFAAAGVERLMLQWLDLDDLDGMAAVGRLLG
ncbi:MAG TPA: TIGR03560 family F420-dependent LLM class oxidoreductase [Chloroflexota bacterium]|nr:TIGR03560 family F420-dependent LLM class oxidoreductase [Chloroflexota bacterium]